MADQNGKSEPKGITGITVSGFKSLRDESHIEVRPLTILAGANSSGKSSIMQPLLLMKQTLEANYNPSGTFKLDGPNVKFTSATQFLTRLGAKEFSTLRIGLDVAAKDSFTGTYEMKGWDFDILENEFQYQFGVINLRPDMSNQEVITALALFEEDIRLEAARWQTVKEGYFLGITREIDSVVTPTFNPGANFQQHISRVIHVPGLRGNPERTYKSAGLGPKFAGTFDNYTASVINHWSGREYEKFQELRSQLKHLALTSNLMISRLDDVRLELFVDALPSYIEAESHNFVSIADVGLGVSQSLPVLVALLVAEPGQLVYIEQPELHLHPKAQVALAHVLADAANRGVRVVVETHSSLLLLGIQTLIAEGKLAPDKTILHWFTRNDDGATTIKSVVPDENGAYGDWPVDFDDVELNAQKRYLDAVAEREMGL